MRISDMFKTRWAMKVGARKDGSPIYTNVFTDGNKYYVKWNGRVLDVTSKCESFKEKRVQI